MTPNHFAHVEWAYNNHRALWDQNIGRTCDRIIELVLTRINDPAWGRVGKDGGAQFRPDDWINFETPGFDGRLYTMTGWSHDAIFHKPTNQQVDIIGGSNHYDQPIYRRQGEPNWSFDPADGPQIRATPTWDEIAQRHNRPNNPWIAWPRQGQPSAPQPAATLPGRAEMMDEGQRLHAYYASHEGLQRVKGLSINDAPDWEGVGAWLFDVYLVNRLAGKTREQSRAAYVSMIRHTDEWKTKHPGETP